MSLSPQVEKEIQEVIIKSQFQKNIDFEDICYRLMKRLREYSTLVSRKHDPYLPAPGEGPDAYIYLKKEDSWIYCEYTETDRRHIKEYVTRLSERNYYKNKFGKIQEIVIVSSQPLEENEKIEYEDLVKQRLNCLCQVFDVKGLVSIFSEKAPDLVEPLIGIECHPKWFSTLGNAVSDLNSLYFTFPGIEEFHKGTIYMDENLAQKIIARTLKCEGPCLLTGRWGSGKTVFVLALGFRLQKENDFSVYYLDLNRLIRRNYIDVTGKLKNTLRRFHYSQVVFIIDNAHVFPQVSYQLAQWAISEKANVILVSRPVLKECCEEKQYFPGLFQTVLTEVPIVDTEEVLEDSDSNKEEVSLTERSPCFELRVTHEIRRGMIDRRLRQCGVDYEIPDSELEALYERIGHNLTLLSCHLVEWNPKSGPISKINMRMIYETLVSRFHLQTFPEIYLLASLNHFDCPADLTKLFQTPEQKSTFISNFLSENGNARGLILNRKNCVFGINSADAWLICEAGLFYKEPFLCDHNGRLPSSVTELLKVLLVRYASRKPGNPYEMLRCLRWAAFEAQEYEGPQKEEELQEILASVLTCSEFMDFLRDVILPEHLSMLGLGNIARLYKYVGLLHHYYLNVLSQEVVKRGIVRCEYQWRDKHVSEEHYFTWRELFAWRHLRNLDEELGSFFLKQFEYARLYSHGKNSLRGLSNLFFMAAKTEWLKQKVQADLKPLFGTPEEFYEKFSKLPEVAICFFIRHAYLFGDSSVEYLRSYMPPKKMALVAKGLPKRTAELFHSIRYLGFDYAGAFASEFEEEEIYNVLYSQSLASINCALSNYLYQRFLKNDLTPKITASTLNEIQLFLRNLSLHGFQDGHRISTAEQFLDKSLKGIIISKILQEKPPLIDVAFFLLNLDALSPRAAEEYVSYISSLKLDEITTDASLSGLALFFLSIWIAGYSPLTLVSIDVVQKMINEKISKSSVHDLLMIGGVINLLKLDLHIPLAFEDLANRVGCYLAKLEPDIPEEEPIRWQQLSILKLALTIEGICFFGGSIYDSMISSYLNKSFIPHIIQTLTHIKEQIEKDASTTMSIALGRLPSAVERKIRLLQNSISWFSSELK